MWGIDMSPKTGNRQNIWFVMKIQYMNKAVIIACDIFEIQSYLIFNFLMLDV